MEMNINIIRTDYKLFKSLLGDNILSFSKIIGFNPVPMSDYKYVDFEYDGGQLEFLRDISLDNKIKLIAAAGRGTGKTKILSIGNFFNLFHDYQIFNLSGSEEQSKKIKKYIDDIITMFRLYHIMDSKGETISIKGTKYYSYFSPASTKKVRGVHFDPSTKGLFVLDEVAEIDNDLVEAGFRIGTTHSNIFKVAMTSTRHRIDSIFNYYFDNAKKLGYNRYYWDQFEISCCNYDCDTCIPEFSKNTYIDNNGNIFYSNKKEREDWKLLRKAYCGGRSKRKCITNLFIIDKIKDDFYSSSSHEVFEVENLGRSAKISQFVIKDRVNLREIFDSNFDESEFFVYYTLMGIDWGFSGETAIMIGQIGLYKRNKIVLYVKHYEFHSRVRDTLLYSRIENLFKKYNIKYISADSSHPFNNDHLKGENRLPLYEAVFSKIKDLSIGLINNLVEEKLLYFNKNIVDFDHLKEQFLNWKRDKKGKIIKKDDHGPDSMVAMLANETIYSFRINRYSDFYKNNLQPNFVLDKRKEDDWYKNFLMESKMNNNFMSNDNSNTLKW